PTRRSSDLKLRVCHPEGRLPWRVTRYLSIRRIEGEKGRVGEWERVTKRKTYSVCVYTGSVGSAEGHEEMPNSVCVNHRAQGEGGGEGEGGRGGEGHKEKAILSVCLQEPRETRGD